MTTAKTGRQLAAAVLEYQNRQARCSHPSGSWDSAGRFYLSDNERCECCVVRSPSRAYPYSEMKHARTAKHVANLFEVDYKQLLEAIQNA